MKLKVVVFPLTTFILRPTALSNNTGTTRLEAEEYKEIFWEESFDEKRENNRFNYDNNFSDYNDFFCGCFSE